VEWLGMAAADLAKAKKINKKIPKRNKKKENMPDFFRKRNGRKER
jgi:hypothetical protein